MTASFCSACGQELEPGHGCKDSPLEPPRYCSQCGSWLAVTVTPTGYRARCRTHGER